jgi:hypothetical protein
MAIRHILDGAASIFAALVTTGVCGVPAWYSVQAVRVGLAPQWVYGAAGALALIGAILAFAFLRKAIGGVAPTRLRRR